MFASIKQSELLQNQRKFNRCKIYRKQHLSLGHNYCYKINAFDVLRIELSNFRQNEDCITIYVSSRISAVRLIRLVIEALKDYKHISYVFIQTNIEKILIIYHIHFRKHKHMKPRQKKQMVLFRIYLLESQFV